MIAKIPHEIPLSVFGIIAKLTIKDIILLAEIKKLNKQIMILKKDVELNLFDIKPKKQEASCK